MLNALARNWGWLMFRAILAASYGMAAFAWPDITLVGFVYLFGLYAVFDGMVALAIAIDVKAFRGFGTILFEAIVRTGGGLVAMGEPGVILTFPRFLAGWALLTGVAEAAVALVLRRELSGEWPLPFAAGVSALVAGLLLLTPITVGVPELRWLIGPYEFMFGVTFLAFARRLRQLAQEMQAG
jgi:uncharacterized membrane protein HdeD (DUF308 family)